MNAAMIARAVAVIIALAGAIDPGFTHEAPRQTPVTIVVLDPERPESIDAADRLRSALRGSFGVELALASHEARTSACPPERACIIVGGGNVPERLVADGASLAGIVQLDETDGGSRFARILAPPTQHPAAGGRLRVELTEAPPPDARVDVFDGAALVGSAAVPAAATHVDVAWWPIEAGPRRLTARLHGAGESDAVDQADVGIDVRATAADVLVYDTRPSWASLFLRRAIESDPRFSVRARSRLGPDLAVDMGAVGRLDRTVLEEASVVVIGGPDALTAAEVDLLDAFVRVRGGSLVLLPDQPLSGPVARLVPGGARERLERTPIAVGPLRASELLVLPSAAPWRALESTADGQRVIAAWSTGQGRITVAGAMDAWRYRDTDGTAFDGMWRSLVADAASAAGAPVAISVSPRVARPGEDIRVEITYRSMDETMQPVLASAEVACDDAPPASIRLWPSGRRRLAGVFSVDRAAVCHVRASAASPRERSAETAVLVAGGVRRADARTGAQRLEILAAAWDAPRVRAGEERALAERLAGRTEAQKGRATVYPMRSPWWLVPFVAALSCEWWLRRRRGMR